MPPFALSPSQRAVTMTPPNDAGAKQSTRAASEMPDPSPLRGTGASANPQGLFGPPKIGGNLMEMFQPGSFVTSGPETNLAAMGLGNYLSFPSLQQPRPVENPLTLGWMGPLYGGTGIGQWGYTQTAQGERKYIPGAYDDPQVVACQRFLSQFRQGPYQYPQTFLGPDQQELPQTAYHDLQSSQYQKQRTVSYQKHGNAPDQKRRPIPYQKQQKVGGSVHPKYVPPQSGMDMNAYHDGMRNPYLGKLETAMLENTQYPVDKNLQAALFSPGETLYNTENEEPQRSEQAFPLKAMHNPQNKTPQQENPQNGNRKNLSDQHKVRYGAPQATIRTKPRESSGVLKNRKAPPGSALKYILRSGKCCDWEIHQVPAWYHEELCARGPSEIAVEDKVLRSEGGKGARKTEVIPYESLPKHRKSTNPLLAIPTKRAN